MKILILGQDGMLGHVVKEYFIEHGYDVLGTSRRKDSEFYFDAAQNIGQIDTIISITNPDVVINCIGILNKAAEEHKSLAIQINSLFPHYMDELSLKYNFYFIHVTTDCVFSGTKGLYQENSFKDAQNFYGQSKALGEINNDRNVSLRTSIVGPDINENGIGLFNWFIHQKGTIKGFSQAIWSGVTTIQLAECMDSAIKNHLTGLYHVVNNESISKYDLLYLFKKYFNSDVDIQKDDTYVCDKSLVSTRDYQFSIPSYEQMISNMREWVEEHPTLYPNLIKKVRE